MEKIKTDPAHYRNIAAKIREKTVGEESYLPSDMPGGIDQVYEAGKKAEREAFWDNLQNYGSESGVIYYHAFAYNRYTDQNYNPKYPIYGTTSAGSLREIYYSSSNITDTKVPIYDRHGVGLINTFNDCTCIKNIRLLGITSETTFTTTFYNCRNLEEIKFEGVIGQNGLNFQWSPLSHDSITSIINALEDKTEDTSGTTWLITLGNENVAKLTAEDIALIDSKSWNYA